MNSSVGDIVTSGAVDKLADILHKLAGPMAEEVGLLMADKLKVYRLKNLIAVTRKMDRILTEAGLSPDPIPPRLFLPMLDSSSLESDEALQELWAGLLASASEQADSLSPSFIETLKQLTPGEAKGLTSLFEYAKNWKHYRLGPPEKLDAVWSVERVSNPERFPHSTPQLIAETGERLGLIRREYDLHERNPSLYRFQTLGGASRSAKSTAFYGGTANPTHELIYSFEFTEYGVQFMKACLGPGTAAAQSDTKP